ncbi:MAG: hypothetical protein DRG78_00390 [Epsilonproteobacteria bacterium]|nr:MAG: hypothetical protein DRG78_00390 [Campylobacterota bacterium]
MSTISALFEILRNRYPYSVNVSVYNTDTKLTIMRSQSTEYYFPKEYVIRQVPYKDFKKFNLIFEERENSYENTKYIKLSEQSETVIKEMILYYG